MPQNITSLISASILLLLATYCCALVSDEESKLLPKSIAKESQNRFKRQFGGGNNFSNGFGGGNFNGNFGGGLGGGGRRRGQRPRQNQNSGFFPNDNNNNNQNSGFFPNNNNNNNFGGFPGNNGGGNGGGSGGNELIFSGNPNGQINNFNNGGGGGGGNPTAPAVTTPATFVSNGQNGNIGAANNNAQLVFINNRPTIATMAPFIGRTTASPQYLTCFNSCATTSEYNPICGSDQELYFNEQKFNCAVRCGANIQIVRRGSCAGLFPMMRG